MHFLPILTPAETLVLFKGVRASTKELLQYTFMDLRLKEVLKIQNEAAPGTEPLLYVSKGKNVGTYIARPHEQIFITPFQKIATSRLTLRNLVKIVIHSAKNDAKYRRMITGQSLSQYVKRGIFFRLIGLFLLNQEGRKARVKITEELQTLADTFPALWSNDREKAIEIIRQIKGNVYLVGGWPKDLLKEIGQALYAEEKVIGPNDTFSACGGWAYFPEVSNEFDSSCSTDSDGCSSCGGD